MKVNCQMLTVKCQNGQMLIVAIIFLAVVLILVSSLFSRVSGFLRSSSNATIRKQATYLAEAGIENTMWQLNKTAGVCGTCQNETQLGTTGSFKVSIVNKTSSLKTIISQGCIPNCTNPKTKQTIRVDAQINAESVEFHYAIQVGTGGIIMSNSATINGTVYSNASDGVLKSIQGYNSSRINGDAYAVGTISSPAPNVTGVKFPNQSPSEMPVVNYQYWKDIATAGGTTTCTGSNCNFANVTQNIGPRKYVGNVNVSNASVLTVQGPIYITGNLNVSNDNTQINLNNGFGSNGTVMIVDGTASISNGSKFNPTNASPPGYILVASTSTSNSALTISNEGVNALFYALNGGAFLSNNAKMTALVAKTLTMSNTASLTYDTGLADAQFSTGPGGSWAIKKGTYRYTASP